MPPEMSVDADEYASFIRHAEPRLRRALVTRFGVDVGMEVANDALAWSWEHWPELRDMANPVGYLCRVGQSSARRYVRWTRRPDWTLESTGSFSDPEPELVAALRRLKPDQRVAVVLVHGYGWPYADVAEVMDIPITTLRNHLSRGLTRLRNELEER